jgi:biotin carboxyl carrier protein
MSNFKFTISGNTYEVEILKIDDEHASIEVNGTPYEIDLHREKKESKTPTLVRKVVQQQAEDIAKKDRGSTSPILAPLPGTILEINVKIGDIVKKDQTLMIMEAMKMENLVKAEKAGVIEAIKVSVGDSVLQGDVVFEIV